ARGDRGAGRAASPPRGRATGDRRAAPGRQRGGVSRGDPSRRRGRGRDLPTGLRPRGRRRDLLRRRRRRRLQLPGHRRQRLAAPGVRAGHAGGRDRGRELSRVPHRRRDRAADRAGSRACAGGGARRRAGGAGARGAHGAGGARARGVDVVVGRERQGDRRALRDARARRRVVLALAVAALALAIRVLVAEFLPVIQPDGVVYVAVAKQFQATGSPFDPLFHPLYPILIALAQPFVGDWEMSGRLVSAFFGALVILPAFALARGIVGRQAALLSVVFIAVHPRLVQNAASVLCEATYTFLLVSGVLPMRVLENVLLFQKYAVPDLLPWVLLLLVLPGLLARGRTSGWFGRDGILLAAAVPPFASLGFHVEPRVFLPILPFILPFAAVGTLWAAVTLTDARRGWRWSLAMALLVALVLVPWTFQPILRPDAGAALYRQAARWVAETQPRDAVLLDRKPLIAFYSERRWVPLPRIGPDELLAAARHAGARLVVLDSRELFFDRPGLIPLHWGPPPPGLDVLRDFDPAPADRLRLPVVNDRAC